MGRVRPSVIYNRTYFDFYRKVKKVYPYEGGYISDTISY